LMGSGRERKIKTAGRRNVNIYDLNNALKLSNPRGTPQLDAFVLVHALAFTFMLSNLAFALKPPETSESAGLEELGEKLRPSQRTPVQLSGLEELEEIRKLGENHSEESVLQLIKTLKKTRYNPQLRMEALRSLGRIERLVFPVESVSRTPNTLIGSIAQARLELGIGLDQIQRAILPNGENEIVVEIRFNQKSSPKEKLGALAKRLDQLYGSFTANHKIQAKWDKIVATFQVSQANLSQFWEVLGTGSVMMGSDGNLRSFTKKELFWKLEERARILAAGLQPDSPEYEDFVKYVYGDGTKGNPGFLNIAKEPERYGDLERIVWQSGDSRRNSYNELLDVGRSAPYFARSIPTSVEVEMAPWTGQHVLLKKPVRKFIFPARGAGSIYLSRELIRRLQGVPVEQEQNLLFSLSGVTLGKYVRELARTEIDRLIGSSEVIYFRELEEKMMRFLEVRYNSDEVLKSALDAVYLQLKRSGALEDLQPGDVILIVDEWAKGAFDLLFKYIVEKTSEREGKPIRVAIFVGAPREVTLAGYPALEEHRLSETYGVATDEAKRIIDGASRVATAIPHPLRVKVQPDEAPITGLHVPMELESPEVLLGVYLRSLLLYNGVIEFYHAEPVNNFETLWSIIYSAKNLFNPL